MNKFIKSFSLIVIVVSFIITSCSDDNIVQHNNPPPDDQVSVAENPSGEPSVKGKVAENRYIVIFKEQSSGIASAQAAQTAAQKTDAVLSDAGIPADSLIHRYKWASQGFAGRFSADQAEKLRSDPRVEHVVKDYYYQAIQVSSYKTSAVIKTVAASETTPWGISRVNGPLDGSGKQHGFWIPALIWITRI